MPKLVWACSLSPPDESMLLEHTPPPCSGGEADGAGPLSSGHCPVLAPTLTPASQPTISLLTDNGTQSLSVESLTLLPPADSPHLHPCTSHIPAAHSLKQEEATITEVGEELEKEVKEAGQRAEDDDETETDATVKEDTTTTELLTPTDEAPDDPPEEQTDPVYEQQQPTESETPDSPELD